MPFSIIPDRLYSRYTDLTPRALQELDVRLLLCDLDYTLAPRSVEKPEEELRAWLNACQDSGIIVMILSNNRSSRRVNAFCGDLGISYVDALVVSENF